MPKITSLDDSGESSQYRSFEAFGLEEDWVTLSSDSMALKRKAQRVTVPASESQVVIEDKSLMPQ